MTVIKTMTLAYAEIFVLVLDSYLLFPRQFQICIPRAVKLSVLKGQAVPRFFFLFLSEWHHPPNDLN